MTIGGAVVVDVHGVHFRDVTIPVCDILIEGRRVMSMLPGEQREVSRGRSMIVWPPRLKPLLRGSGRVVVQEHGSGVVHYDGELRFDGSTGRTRVVDATGTPVIVNKWGDLARSFEDSTDVDEQIEMTAALLRDLNEIGVPAFIAYGTLLGAVRSGKVIGHDTDADVSYLSAFSHPADIARESFVVQRELLKRGWKIVRGRLGKLTVAQLHKVDIFVSYFYGEHFYLDQWAEGPLRRDQMLPLSTVTLEGHELPAPADPAALLALNYGPGWATPDPSFSYDTTAPQLARSIGWFGGHTRNKIAWNRWWARSTESAAQPSPFAVWVAERIDKNTTLLDLGCGDGADTIALARLGIKAIGWDFAGTAVRKARRAAVGITPRPKFKMISLADARVSLAQGALVAAMPGPKTVTARLLLDTLPPDGYANFWLLLRMATARGGRAYLEFRLTPTPPMADSPQRFWRQVVDLDDVRRRIERIGGVISEDEKVRADESAEILAPVRRLAVTFDPDRLPDWAARVSSS